MSEAGAGTAAAEVAARVAEQVARDCSGKLIAILADAEDALSEALTAAVRVWPTAGVPANPAAWRVTAARNGRHDIRRHVALRQRAEPEVLRRIEERQDSAEGASSRASRGRFGNKAPDTERGWKTPVILGRAPPPSKPQAARKPPSSRDGATQD